MNEIPDFHAEGLTFRERQNKLLKARQHSEAHLHADKFARVLHEPFSLLHSSAVEALFEIHDKKPKSNTLALIVEGYNAKLREYKQNRGVPGLRAFLDRTREALQARKINVAPAEPEPSLAHKLQYGLEALRRTTKPRVIITEPGIDTLLIKFVLRKHYYGDNELPTYGEIFNEFPSNDIDGRKNTLINAIIGHKKHEPRKGYAALRTKWKNVKSQLEKSGFSVKRERTHSDGEHVLFDLEASNGLKKFLEHYKHDVKK